MRSFSFFKRELRFNFSAKLIAKSRRIERKVDEQIQFVDIHVDLRIVKGTREKSNQAYTRSAIQFEVRLTLYDVTGSTNSAENTTSFV